MTIFFIFLDGLTRSRPGIGDILFGSSISSAPATFFSGPLLLRPPSLAKPSRPLSGQPFQLHRRPPFWPTFRFTFLGNNSAATSSGFYRFRCFVVDCVSIALLKRVFWLKVLNFMQKFKISLALGIIWVVYLNIFE